MCLKMYVFLQKFKKYDPSFKNTAAIQHSSPSIRKSIERIRMKHAIFYGS
jgi:hypothetical protein